MSDKKATEAEPQKAGTPAKSGKTFIIIGAVVLLLAGGGGGFWWFSRGAHAAALAEPKKEAAEAGGGVVPLEPFLVNLADKSGTRYLRTTLKLIVPDEKTAERLAKNDVAITRARSAILELLTTETADQLVTAEGKTVLKKAIGERVSPLVGVQVTDVLFADFVVQF
jgi:flagellar protein FliL